MAGSCGGVDKAQGGTQGGAVPGVDTAGFQSAMQAAGVGGAGALGSGRGGGPGAAFLQQAAQLGLFRLGGQPQHAKAAFNLYADLLSANPDMMQGLAQHFQQGGTWTVEAGNSGSPKSANQGNSFATVGQPNAYTYLDFGDARFGMYEVGAHEFGHAINGLQHVPALFQAAERREQNVLGRLRAA